MKKRKLLTKLAAGVMALALCVTGFNTSLAAAPDGAEQYNVNPTPAVYQYSDADPLFAATHFHIFAEDEASITTHCNGNVATKYFYQRANSGSNILYPSQGTEYSYIRKLQVGSITKFADGTKVVFGKETNVYNKDDAEIYIEMYDSAVDTEPDVSKMDVSFGNVFTEKGSATTERFINFDAEFQKLSILSYNLAKESSTGSLKVDENVINMGGVADGTTAFVNTTPSELMNRAFVIDNTNFLSGQALVINVDLGTLTEYTIPFTQVLFKDETGTSFGTGEDKGDYTGYGNVLWNFYGRDENGKVVNYTGKLNTCSEFKGTILAPDAEIYTASSNQDGNFIGREVHLGGGETHRWDFGGTLPSYTYEVSYSSLKAVVTESGTNTGVANVEIYVYEKDDESETEPFAKIVTDANGETIVIGDIPVGGQYTGVVKQIPYGYTIADDTETVTINSTDLHKLEFELDKDQSATTTPSTGYIKVIVKDKDTGNYIEDVTVVIANNVGTVSGSPFTTDEFGTAVTDKLAITGTTEDNYHISITHVPTGYNKPSSETVTVSTANPDVIVFELIKETDDSPKGSIQIKVYEAGSDRTKPVEGAVISVKDNGNHIIKEITVVTNEDGETEIVENLTQDSTYTTTMISVPDGYKLADGDDGVESKIITDAKPDVVIYELEKIMGSMQVSVVEDDNTTPVEGVAVEITDVSTGKVIATYTTNAEGLTEEKYNLTVGGQYKATITVPDGYEIVGDTTKTGTVESIDEVLTLKFVVKEVQSDPETGDLQVTITDKNDPTKPIPGAKVEILDVNGDVVAEGETDEAGKTEIFEDLPVGDYTIHVESVPENSGYTAPEDKDTTVKKDELTEETLVVDKPPVTPDPETGDLQVTITDKNDPTKPIPGAKVEILDTNGDVVAEGETDEAGKTEIFEDLPVGDYTIHVESVPENSGYTAPEDKDTTVKKDELTEETLVVDKTPVTPDPETGDLQVTITDKNDPTKPIPGAKVEILDANGDVVAEGETDEAGKTEIFEDLPVGDYTIHVESVPENSGYTAPEDKDTTVKKDELTEETLIVEKTPVTPTPTPEPEKGKMDVVITDKNTSVPIPGATVVIKDKDGNVIETVTTDSNGKTPVIDELTVGETYTVETTKVPEGYTAPTPTTQKITGTELVTVPLVVGRDSGITSSTGSLYVIITDKNTGEPIPGATVVVSNSAGEKIETVITDSTGAFTVTNLTPDTYSVTTTKVPEGYTAPDDQSAEVKSNARTDVHLYVAKGTTTGTTNPPTTDTTVQTGDESNVQSVSILGIIACLGIVVVSIMRKREEA